MNRLELHIFVRNIIAVILCPYLKDTCLGLIILEGLTELYIKLHSQLKRYGREHYAGKGYIYMHGLEKYKGQRCTGMSFSSYKLQGHV